MTTPMISILPQAGSKGKRESVRPRGVKSSLLLLFSSAQSAPNLTNLSTAIETDSDCGGSIACPRNFSMPSFAIVDVCRHVLSNAVR